MPQNEVVLRRGETLEPPTKCQYRAGERVKWKKLHGSVHTGHIHEIRWGRWTWMLGVWKDGDERRISNGKPCLDWVPLDAEKIKIKRI